MAPERQSNSSLTVEPDQPLVGVVVVENGREVVRYFAEEDETDVIRANAATEDARNLAGAWADLDWDEAVAELDRIRRQSAPTPPIDTL